MTAWFSDEHITIYNQTAADLSDLFDNSVDLVFTDPPYLRSELYTYQYLADQCPRVMRDGASLLTIVGHYAIPDVVEMLRETLKYRWIVCMNQFEGNHPRMAMGIEVMWKPILWFVKRAYPQGRGFLRDGIVIAQENKKLHKWQQSESWARYYVERLCPKDGVVLDPFMGSGTTLKVAYELGRKAIGYDTSEECCYTTLERIYGGV